MNLNLNTFSLKGKGLYISRTIEPLCLWYRKKTLMCFDLTLKHTRSSDSLVSKASVRDLLVRYSWNPGLIISNFLSLISWQKIICGVSI